MFLCFRVQSFTHFLFHRIPASCFLSSTHCLNHHAKILKIILKERQTICPLIKHIDICKTEFTPTYTRGKRNLGNILNLTVYYFVLIIKFPSKIISVQIDNNI